MKRCKKLDKSIHLRLDPFFYERVINSLLKGRENDFNGNKITPPEIVRQLLENYYYEDFPMKERCQRMLEIIQDELCLPTVVNTAFELWKREKDDQSSTH